MEYNNNPKETRRHSSLDDPSGKGGHIPCEDNLEEMAERLEEIEALKQAVVTLGQTQKVLLRRVYILEEKQSEIVRRGGAAGGHIQTALQGLQAAEKIF